MLQSLREQCEADGASAREELQLACSIFAQQVGALPAAPLTADTAGETTAPARRRRGRGGEGPGGVDTGGAGTGCAETSSEVSSGGGAGGVSHRPLLDTLLTCATRYLKGWLRCHGEASGVSELVFEAPPRHPLLPYVAHPFSPYLRIQFFFWSL